MLKFGFPSIILCTPMLVNKFILSKNLYYSRITIIGRKPDEMVSVNDLIIKVSSFTLTLACITFRLFQPDYIGSTLLPFYLAGIKP